MSKEVYSPRRADILSGGANVNIHPGVWPQYSDAGTSGPLCSEISRDPARVLTEELKPGTGLDDWKFMLEKVGRDQQWVLERTQVGADCSVTALPKEDSSVVWAYSFNEWFEGAGIEPLEQKAGDFPYGFGDKLISTLGGDTNASSSTKPVVAAPLLRAPKGSQDTRRPTFAYDGVHNATEYEIEVRKADGSLVLSRTSAATVFVPRPVSGSATINGENGLDLPYATNYEWRVRAANGTGTGPWSEYQLFSTPSSSGIPSCGNLVCDEAAGEDADNCPDDCETGPGTNACHCSAHRRSRLLGRGAWITRPWR